MKSWLVKGLSLGPEKCGQRLSPHRKSPGLDALVAEDHRLRGRGIIGGPSGQVFGFGLAGAQEGYPVIEHSGADLAAFAAIFDGPGVVLVSSTAESGSATAAAAGLHGAGGDLLIAEAELAGGALADGAEGVGDGFAVLGDVAAGTGGGRDVGELEEIDGLPGADHLGNDARLAAFLTHMAASGRYVAALCAAPRILAKLGLLDGKTATAYPGFIDRGDFPKVRHTGAPVERDGKIITGRGPGTAMDFALALTEALAGEQVRATVEKALVRP